MTIEEHVDNICNWKHNLGLRNAVLEEMQAAVDEEREACAKIAAYPTRSHSEIAGAYRARSSASGETK